MSPSTAAALPPPPGRSRIGVIRRILRDPTPVLDEIAAAGLPIVGFGRGVLRMAIVAEPHLVHEVFSMPVTRFRWSHPLNVLRFVVGEQSMLVSDGDDHRRRRRAVLPALARRRLDRWVPTIVDQADAAITALLAEAAVTDGPVDLAPHGRRVTMTVVVQALFGSRLAARVDELSELFKRPQAYLESPFVRQLPHPLPFTRRARVRHDRRTIDAIVDAEIAHRRGHPEYDDNDLLTVLVHSGELTDAEIRDQVVTLIGAGYDTTAASLSWTVWRATTASGVWDELRREADTAFAEPAKEGLLGRLPFAANVVRETLRLHPAGVVAPRLAAEDIALGPYVLRRGTLVMPSPYLAGRDPGAWCDPLGFDPHRFDRVTDEPRAIANPAWVPFGAGARSCIGFALAQLELTIIIARMAQRLDLQPTSTAIPPPTGLVVSRPRDGVPMLVATRRARSHTTTRPPDSDHLDVDREGP
jgi:cytochrome P450